MKWTVHNQLFALVSALCTAFIATNVISLVNLADISKQGAAMYNDQVRSMAMLGDLRWDIGQIRTAAAVMINLGKDDARQQVASAHERQEHVLSTFAALKRQPMGQAEKKLMSQLDSELSEYLNAKEITFQKALQGDREGARFNMTTTARVWFLQLSNSIDKLTDLAVQQAEGQKERMATAATSARYLLITACGLALAFGLGLGALVSRRITKRLEQLNRATLALAKGDLSQRSQVAGADEIAELSHAFDRMGEDLSRLVGRVRMAVIQVSNTSSELATQAGQAGTSAAQVAATIEQIASGTSDQTIQATTAAQQSAAMRTVAGDAADCAAQATAASQRAIQAATSGRDDLQAAVAKIQSLHESVVVSADAVQRLGDLGGQIGAIVNLIRGIASQTNLLALNAAIEAARAGEQGRGFAVVAEEVRKLASESAESTQQITAMIDTIQKETQAAVHAMNSGKAEASQGVQLIRHADESIDSALQAVQSSDQQITTITTAVTQLRKGLDVMTNSVENIAAIVEETAASAQEVAAAAEEQRSAGEAVNSSSADLARMSVDLRELTDRFTLSEGGANLHLDVPTGIALAGRQPAHLRA